MKVDQAIDSTGPMVYVVEQQPYDYASAEAFGKVHFMEPRKLAPRAPSETEYWNKGVVHSIRKELAEYVPAYDFVIPTGQPSRIMVVGMVLASLGQVHKILGWDNRTQRYLEYVIDFKNASK